MSDLMGHADFAALPCTLSISTEDGSGGQRGLVTDVLEPLLASATAGSVTIYACGPTPMMRACGELAKSHQDRCFVSLENNMACGFGVCLGCAVPKSSGGFSLVCHSGPVFESSEVDWEGLP